MRFPRRKPGLTESPKFGQCPKLPARPKDEACRAELKNEVSTLNIDITASAGELSDMLNRLVGKEFYPSATKTKGVSATLLRNVPISLSLSYGIFETPAIQTKLRFKLNPKVSQDWKFNVEVYYMGQSDSLADEVRIGPTTVCRSY